MFFVLCKGKAGKRKKLKRKEKILLKRIQISKFFASIKDTVDDLNIEHKTIHERLKSLDEIIDTLQKRRKQLQ